jgi:predicted peroxiredoxin
MRRLLKLLLPAVLLVTGVGLGSDIHATDDDAKTTLFLNVTSDDAWETQMAFAYAEKVRDMGYPVVVFLNARAVRWANNSIPQPSLPALEKTPRGMLAHLMEKDVEIHVCPMCTEHAGLSSDNWMDGVVGGSPKTIEIQMDPMTKVMSY